MNSKAIRDILIGSRSWSATPWDYSSMVYLQFYADDSGIAIFGHGQTIYAELHFRFALGERGRIKLTYLDSPALGRFTGFIPTKLNSHKELHFSLAEKQQIFSESVTGCDFRFSWTLTFGDSPFADGLTFPYAVPGEYYGYREADSEEKPELGA